LPLLAGTDYIEMSLRTEHHTNIDLNIFGVPVFGIRNAGKYYLNIGRRLQRGKV